MAPCFKNWLGSLEAEHPARPRRQVLLLAALVGEAWESVGNNRLRTFLAMLGIVIGVASVVVLLGIGTASQRQVERAINTLGTNLLVITAGGRRSPITERYAFDTKDVTAIAELPLAETVAYSSAVASRTLFARGISTQARIIGTVPEYLVIRNWNVDEGQAFSADDIQHGVRVVLLGHSVAERLFPDSNPVGRVVYLDESRVRFEVLGVLESKGPGLSGEDQDNIAFVPITSYKTYLASPYEALVHTIYVKAGSPDNLVELSESIREVLRQRHRVPESRPDHFTIQNVNAVVQVASETSRAFTLLLGAVASISLLVGGIGIMNIMLVTVSERTREIGIRKAIGATRRHIMLQFLLEAVIISGAGCVGGLLLGLAGGLVASHGLSLEVAFDLWPVLLALGMALGIGLPSGLYPAYKASRLAPIEALRSIG
mgnify:FL=1